MMTNKKSTAGFWDMVLRGEKILSGKEAEELERLLRRIRKDYGFRT